MPQVNKWSVGVVLVLLACASLLPGRHAARLGRLPQEALQVSATPVVRPLAWLVGSGARRADERRQEAADPRSLGEMRAQLAEAHWHNDRLYAELTELRQGIAWYEQLRPFIEVAGFQRVIAPVVGPVAGGQGAMLQLARGSQATLTAGQVVIGGTGGDIGLVGWLAEPISPLHSRVRLLVSPDVKLSCLIRAPGMAGQGGLSVRLLGDPDQGCLLGLLPRGAQVQAGDEVVLNDPDHGRHVRGLMLGRVTEVRPSPERPLLEDQVVVQPLVRPALLTRVIVLVPEVTGTGQEVTP